LSQYAVECQTVAPKLTLIIAIVAILAPVAAMAKAQASQIPRHIKITPFNS
jgi:multisubunit Na+/H+ antiporter MnhG subunit